MAKKPRDSGKKNELITTRYILINIYKGQNEVKREVNGEAFKERQQKSSTRFCDGVIVRQWMENECDHHVKESQTFCKAQAKGVLTVNLR